MIFIGERINTGFKDVKAAVMEKNAEVLKEWARKQTKAGATYLDVNIGAVSDKPEDLCWMIENVQDSSDLPISIDTNKPALLQEAIKACNKPPLVNSITADETKADEILPIIAEAGASVVGLVMDESGSPMNADKRVENAGRIFAKIMEYDMSPEQLFLDPIVMPMKFMQEQAKAVLDATAQFKLFSDPPCHISCGLSNVASKTTNRKLINRTFAVMMVACGMDAVIADVMDTDLVDAILTAELALGKSIYADGYLEAFRS